MFLIEKEKMQILRQSVFEKNVNRQNQTFLEKYNWMQTSKNDEILLEQLGENSSFLGMSSFTSLFGGNHK